MKPLSILENTDQLENLREIPAYLVPGHETGQPRNQRYSCAYCGVGDSATLHEWASRPKEELLTHGHGTLLIESASGMEGYPAELREGGELLIDTRQQALPHSSMLAGTLEIGGTVSRVVARSLTSSRPVDWQKFQVMSSALRTATTQLAGSSPTPGCLKLQTSLGHQRTVLPVHVAPSRLDAETGERESIAYQEAIGQLADLLLAHRPPSGRSLVYACGQVDYFTIFAFQEVFRLLGIRNLAGNAEHCLNAGAVHNEILTGQEGPFLTLENAFQGPNRFFLFNGWNGLVSHPPVFGQLMKRSDFDGYLVETISTESAVAIAKKFGEERILFVRPGSDPHLALAVAHRILTAHPDSVETRFVDQYADPQSFEQFQELASLDHYDAKSVAHRIAPLPELAPRLESGIIRIAERLAEHDTVPINIPSVGLSQTKGAVAHCLWGSVLALVGKYGLRTDGRPAGGTLRLPGQINAQTEVQGLSRGFFMGRIRMTEEGIRDAALRMGLPSDAYRTALDSSARAALDYSDPTEEPELFLCFGTQFERNMPGRKRWLEKLKTRNVKLVVIDPIPDPFALEHADLIIPSPPHSAAAKLYQNGEWRLTQSVPVRQRPVETRTDATIVYDVMAEISRRLRAEPALREFHPDLAVHSRSGYLQRRFEAEETGGELARVEGEVSRPQLWQRIQDYMTGPDDCLGQLYCRPEHADGRLITWKELIDRGEIVYGGVGTVRFRLDYDDPTHIPFRDIYRRPSRFRFFIPTEDDLVLPTGIILNTGRSGLSNDKKRIRFAVSTFNSGKATGIQDLPDDNPLHVSLELAERLRIESGDRVQVTGVLSGATVVLPALLTDRVKGDSVYVCFHRSRVERDEERHLNDLTSHLGRCPYTQQSNFKLTQVTLEPMR